MTLLFEYDLFVLHQFQLSNTFDLQDNKPLIEVKS